MACLGNRIARFRPDFFCLYYTIFKIMIKLKIYQTKGLVPMNQGRGARGAILQT